MNHRYPLALSMLLAACSSHKPPATFAPDPAYIRGMRQVRITVTPERVCPGGFISASYEGQLESGLWVPFARVYEKKRPPKLHVVFLRRTSPEAIPQENGDWSASPDPTISAMKGFRLSAFMRDVPSVQGFASVPPEYSCLPHAFSFEGEPGEAGGSGANGPDVTVRLRYLKSPFYPRLLVAAIEVGAAPPFFVFGDADQIPPADWLIVESRGGRGGRGLQGLKGRTGSDGEAGCPGSTGGTGGPGGPGGPGGSGGRGGRVTIIVPSDQPLLAGLVQAQSVGGAGGAGGTPGAGGVGGKGGAVVFKPGQVCLAGGAGAEGPKGRFGGEGSDGYPGPRPFIQPVNRAEVYGAGSAALTDLISYSDGQSR